MTRELAADCSTSVWDRTATEQHNSRSTCQRTAAGLRQVQQVERGTAALSGRCASSPRSTYEAQHTGKRAAKELGVGSSAIVLWTDFAQDQRRASGIQQRTTECCERASLKAAQLLLLEHLRRAATHRLFQRLEVCAQQVSTGTSTTAHTESSIHF